MGRGIALGDLDNDGDCDPVIVHQNSPTLILRNESVPGRWLKLRFVGKKANRRGIGVRVGITGDDEKSRARIYELVGGSSYASTHEPTLFVPIDAAWSEVMVEVTWPGGTRHRFQRASFNTSLLIPEGGKPLVVATETPELR